MQKNFLNFVWAKPQSNAYNFKQWAYLVALFELFYTNYQLIIHFLGVNNEENYEGQEEASDEELYFSESDNEENETEQELTQQPVEDKKAETEEKQKEPKEIEQDNEASNSESANKESKDAEN